MAVRAPGLDNLGTGPFRAVRGAAGGPVRAQHRIGQLEQLITARRQASVELHPEP
jgi:hypothetical protein